MSYANSPWSPTEGVALDSIEELSHGFVRQTFTGRFDVLHKIRPRVGQRIEGDGELHVTKVHIKPNGAGTASYAKMTITAGPADLN